MDVEKETIDARAGRLLWRARQRAVLTQAEVAANAGLPQSTVSAYESGRRQPTLPMLSKLLEAMGSELKLATAPLPEHLVTLVGPIGLRIRRHRQLIVEVADRYGVEDLRVLGAVTRGEDKPGEQIEFLIDRRSVITVMDLLNLSNDLQELIGARVKILFIDELPRNRRAAAERTGVRL